MYAQCTLKYKDGFNAVIWIESKLAKVGKILEDKELDMQCRVEEVFGEREVSKEQVIQYDKMHRNHRKTTDI